jgi:2',3'-cyclic-nucleotide 2'-phosphodiesterase (5'-nucleotidase family)
MTKKIFAFLGLFVFFSWFACQASADQLTILHTNDTHSHLYPFGPWDNYGGIARMSHLIKELKRANTRKGCQVITLNSGDVFVGTFAFNKYLGYAELKIMEGLYDAMAIGNHEFDLGVESLTGILSGAFSGEVPIQLPALCANIKALDSGHPLHQFVKPSMVQQVGSFKIGLIGVVTTDEYNYSTEVNDILTDPYEAAGEAASLLKQQGCDVVICLSHLGIEPDRQGLAWVPGIDVIVGGHSHTAMFEPEIVNDTIIVQAGEFGKHLGELVLDVNPGGVELVKYKLHPVDRKVRRDFSLLRTLWQLRRGIQQDPRFGPVYTLPVAWARWNLEERWEEGNPNRDTALGNLVTDAIRESIEAGGFTLGDGIPLIAFEANGYIGHRIYRGMVVGNDVLRSVPYGYDPESGLGFKIDLVTLMGMQILAGLEYTVSMAEYTDDLSLQSSGLSFAYDSSKAPAETPQEIMAGNGRIDPASVKIHGVPIDPYGLYQVAINEQLLGFLSMLGLEPFDQVETGLFLYEVVRDYMKKLKILQYTSEGRIIDRALQE